MVALGLLIGFAQLSGIHGAFGRSDVTLQYALYGYGKPVLVLSGFPGATSDYMLEIVRKSKVKGVRWILLEQRGTPLCRLAHPSPQSLALPRFVDDLEALRSHLHIGRWAILGHNWGSLLAHAYTAAHPEHVTRLVLTGDSGPDYEPLILSGDNIDRLLTSDERTWKAKLEDGKQAGPYGDEPALSVLQLELPAMFFSRSASSKAKSLFPTGSMVGNTTALAVPQLVRERWNVTQSLSRFKGPVCIIQGRQDPLGESPVWKDKFAMPQTEAIFIERSGHFPWLERPGAFFAALDPFLAKEAKSP